jgi:catechol 2,3-dioxygenase-like lactoylglutathione lyase family enzyme
MKTHLNLATSDLERSVSFYATLLNAKPAKKLADYALRKPNQGVGHGSRGPSLGSLHRT